MFKGSSDGTEFGSLDRIGIIFTTGIDSVNAWLGGGGGGVEVLMSRVEGRTTSWFRVLFVRAISVEGKGGDPSEG